MKTYTIYISILCLDVNRHTCTFIVVVAQGYLFIVANCPPFFFYIISVWTRLTSQFLAPRTTFCDNESQNHYYYYNVHVHV